MSVAALKHILEESPPPRLLHLLLRAKAPSSALEMPRPSTQGKFSPGRPRVKLVSPPQNQMLVNGAGSMKGPLLWTHELCFPSEYLPTSDQTWSCGQGPLQSRAWARDAGIHCWTPVEPSWARQHTPRKEGAHLITPSFT